ncbi:polysaccharide deacetylase family protein [Litchfieldella rifensis]|uniref:Polysaccharide deacetylase family protein n=1 Tax=Litchfieldella rifensis TaxID=762643 RepID=A0ABV7LSS1_9GAMM
MKEFVRDLASRAVVSCGLSSMGRGLRRHEGAFILYGHRFSDDDDGYLQGLRPAWFADQVAYLTRHYEVIPLKTLIDCLEQRRAVPARSVVLTFDDGFRDNLENAVPILERYRVPATIFMVTRSLTNGELPWSQRLGVIFQRTYVLEMSHPLLGEQPAPLNDSHQRRAAYQRIKLGIAPLQRGERDTLISGLANQLGVEPPLDQMLSWQDARLLQASGVEIGGHSYSHALLGQVPIAEACHEIRRCREELRDHLGLEAAPFCLPGGSYSDDVIRCIKQTGFRSCFIPNQQKRYNTVVNTTPFTLSRLGLPNAPSHHLEAELDGPFHPLRECYHWLQGGYRSLSPSP